MAGSPKCCVGLYFVCVYDLFEDFLLFPVNSGNSCVSLYCIRLCFQVVVVTEDMVEVEDTVEEGEDMAEEATEKMREGAAEVDTTSRIVDGTSPPRGAAEVATETGGITEAAAVEDV